MNNLLPYKTKQFFFVLTKLSIVIGALYFIFNKLTSNTQLNFSAFVDFLSANNIFSYKNISFLCILTLLNWFFEVLKWQKLVALFKNITFKTALEQSLGALTASLLTPNRIGEYGAKAIYFTSNFRKKVVLVNLISNMSQMLATTIFGIIGLYFLISKYSISINYVRISKLLIIALLALIIVGFGIKNTKYRIKGFSIEKIKNFILKLPKPILTASLVLSVTRYLIFSFQFYLLLIIFKIEIDYFDAMVLITSMYFLSSIVPSIFIFDVIIKGSVALYLFTFIHVDELTILSITTLMWILNFVIPSIFGSYYVLNFNLPKNLDET